MSIKSSSEMSILEMSAVLEAYDDAERLFPIELSDSYVRIEENGLSAWLYLTEPPVGNPPYLRTEIVDFLLQKGVLTGFHDSNISAIAKKRIYEREILIAQGSLPVEGDDGYYEYTFETEISKQPVIREDGTADYSSLARITNIHVGDKVAEYHPSIPGTDGFTVQGTILKARLTKDKPALRGFTVRDENNPNIYYAAKEGRVELTDGKIDIQKVLEIHGDVDQILGKVEFFGDIIVTGSVESGVLIRAGRNIEVRGTVEAATLFAGGDVLLNHGIHGQQRAKISARGSVTAGFIEHSIINAGGDVTADYIISSRVSAEGQVVLSGKRGMLAGGHTHAAAGVKIISAGNEAEIRTIIHAGCEAEMYYKEGSLRKQLTQASINPKTSAQELQEMREELESLQEYIEKSRKAQILIDGNIYRGTVVGIMHLEMPIERNTCYMKYGIQGNMIEGNVIIH